MAHLTSRVAETMFLAFKGMAAGSRPLRASLGDPSGRCLAAAFSNSLLRPTATRWALTPRANMRSGWLSLFFRVPAVRPANLALAGVTSRGATVLS